MQAACSHLDQVKVLAPENEVPGCHATAHQEESVHSIIRSVEPREDWSWCYEDQLMFRLPGA